MASQATGGLTLPGLGRSDKIDQWKSRAAVKCLVRFPSLPLPPSSSSVYLLPPPCSLAVHSSSLLSVYPSTLGLFFRAARAAASTQWAVARSPFFPHSAFFAAPFLRCWPPPLAARIAPWGRRFSATAMSRLYLPHHHPTLNLQTITPTVIMMSSSATRTMTSTQQLPPRGSHPP